jgi:hypothetical protein
MIERDQIKGSESSKTAGLPVQISTVERTAFMSARAQGPHRQVLTGRPAAAQQRDVLPPPAQGALQERPKAAQRRNPPPLRLKPPAADVAAPIPPAPVQHGFIRQQPTVTPSTAAVNDPQDAACDKVLVLLSWLRPLTMSHC